jgi:hypothetical protein
MASPLRPRSTDFDNAIDAAPARQGAHGIRPLGVRDVVDDSIGADLLQALALGCALRSRDHARTEKFCKLEREHHDAARALREHRVASTDARQCRPRRHFDARKRRGLLEGQVSRCERQCVRSNDFELCQPAIAI